MIIFTTPGLIDIRSFTMMGLSLKPGTERPIGQFGTGLKYAIAVLIRHGIEPILFIGKDKYTFQRKESDFRGQPIEMIQMKVEEFSWIDRLLLKPKYIDLPFTIEYGKFWDLWQVFRELEANTRDENGVTSDSVLTTGDDITSIIIDHPDFDAVYKDRDSIFLPAGAASGAAIMEVFPGESQYLFYRGMRVQELSKPSLFTHNILQKVDLTEDRTIKYDFQVKELLGNYVVQSDDQAFIHSVVTAREEWWESGVDFSSWSKPRPAAAFMSVVGSRPSGLLKSAEAYHAEHAPSPKQESARPSHPTPWRVHNDWIMDRDNQLVVAKPSSYSGNWSIVARRIAELINQDDDEIPY